MFTILGGDGKEYGPVTADKIHEWIKLGRANAQTSIKRTGDAGWTTIGALSEFNPAPPVLPSGASAPGAAPSLPAGPEPSPFIPMPMRGDASSIAADLIARTPKLDVFGCLAQSFDLWKNNFWPLVGVTLLVMLAQIVTGFIPFIGVLSRLFLNGVFAGGLYYYYLGKVRGEAREVGDAFAGFSKAFVPLMLATLLSTVITLAVMIPFFAPLGVFFIKLALHHQLDAMPPITPLVFLSIFIGILAVMYLSTSWAFAFILVIDRGLGPWTAMEVSRRVVSRQWFRVFFVMFLGGILTMLGIIGLIIGVLFTLPLAVGAVIYAYENSCNPPKPAAIV